MCKNKGPRLFTPFWKKIAAIRSEFDVSYSGRRTTSRFRLLRCYFRCNPFIMQKNRNWHFVRISADHRRSQRWRRRWFSGSRWIAHCVFTRRSAISPMMRYRSFGFINCEGRIGDAWRKRTSCWDVFACRKKSPVDRADEVWKLYKGRVVI